MTIWVTFKDFVALSKYRKFGLLKRMGKSRNDHVPHHSGQGYLLPDRGLPLAFSGLGAGQVIAGWLLMHFVRVDHPRHGLPARPRDGGPRLHARGEGVSSRMTP